MTDVIFKDESFIIIGICMEVHKQLGHGFLEVVYKDALEYEFRKSGISYEREKLYEVKYKDITLKHCYYADFIVFDKIILEVKSCAGIVDEFIIRTINYLKASECKLGLIVNFGRTSLETKRVVY